MELILIIVLFILAILYGLELLKNIKLEKERDIETFEKNKWEMKLKQRESYIEKLREQFNQERGQLNSNSDYTMELINEIEDLKTRIDKKNKRIALLCSKVQSRDKIIAKYKENGKTKV